MTIRFRCHHCPVKLQAPSKLAGRYIACPSCGKNTPVPDSAEETGTYGVLGGGTRASVDPLERLQARSNHSGRPTDDDWCVLNYRSLPPSYQGPLDKARSMARRHEWRQALSELYELFRSVGEGHILPGNYFVRRPLAYCLTHWAIEELLALDESGRQPSQAMRQVFKKGEQLKKWGGTFSMRECALCGRQAPQTRTSAKLKTGAGWAHLCCAAPTREDLRLVKDFDGIRKRLSCAAALDQKNGDVQETVAALPWWYRVLMTEGDGDAGWVRKSRSAGAKDKEDFAAMLGAVIEGANA
jgi:hypothetical protein